MPSQENVSASSDKVERTTDSDDAELQLFDAIKSKNIEQVTELIRKHPNLDLNCLDKDELTPLQHVCHSGDVDIARLLLNNGAGVDYTRRKDGYTPLMFAAISSKNEIVQLLLERGADITIENCVNRTAAQMAAFVGQTKIVSIINNYIPYEASVEPYTRRRELENEPRIPTRHLGSTLHKYIIYPSLHPVKLLLYIHDNSDLVKYSHKFIYVLENLSSKSLKPPNNEESLSLKYYYLSYLIEYCVKSYRSKTGQSSNSSAASNQDDGIDLDACSKVIETNIRRLIRRTNPKDVLPCTIQLDKFIMDCLMKYPYTQLAIFKTMTFALSKREPGDLSAYSILTQTLNGPRMFGHTTEICSICGELDKNKKCSRCKSTYYCGSGCQRIDWFQHKKVCSSPEEEPLIGADDTEDDQ